MVNRAEVRPPSARKRVLAFVAIGLIGSTACAPNGGPGPVPRSPEARAEVRDAQGRVVARAAAVQSGDRLHVRVDAVGLQAGTYGVHVHAVGRCDPPSFDSAGPHWNPTGHEHGSLNPRGAHLGDLPNLQVDADGAGVLEHAIGGAVLSGRPAALLDADGAALVIHAGPDDYRTDPTGNSGARIACGVFG